MLMRVVALYHPNSDHGGIVDTFATEFEHYKNKKIDLASLETEEGSQLAETYGVTQYPAVLAMNDNGSITRMWQGLPLPLMDELSYYAGQNQMSMASRAGKTIMPLSPSTAVA